MAARTTVVNALHGHSVDIPSCHTVTASSGQLGSYTLSEWCAESEGEGSGATATRRQYAYCVVVGDVVCCYIIRDPMQLPLVMLRNDSFYFRSPASLSIESRPSLHCRITGAADGEQ